jgi:neutral ceramidase
VAEVEITPNVLVAMAGYSLAGKIAKGVGHPLYARALYLDDGAGHTAALCFVDLWCASRYLLHKAAAYTLTGFSKIDASQLILAGTHTHAGPGRYFGNTLYDTIVANDLSGFDKTVADRLAAGIAQCVNQAAQSAVPARLGVASAPVWGISRNRAYPAFLENKEAASWNVNGPGEGAPAGLPTVAHFAIDPRVFCLAAVSQDTNTLLGAFATFSCHATALGEDNLDYDPDWPGVASNLAAQALCQSSGRSTSCCSSGFRGRRHHADEVRRKARNRASSAGRTSGGERPSAGREAGSPERRRVHGGNPLHRTLSFARANRRGLP